VLESPSLLVSTVRIGEFSSTASEYFESQFEPTCAVQRNALLVIYLEESIKFSSSLDGEESVSQSCATAADLLLRNVFDIFEVRPVASSSR